MRPPNDGGPEIRVLKSGRRVVKNSRLRRAAVLPKSEPDSLADKASEPEGVTVSPSEESPKEGRFKAAVRRLLGRE